MHTVIKMLRNLRCIIGLHPWERRAVNVRDLYPSLQKSCPNCHCLKSKSELSRYKWQTITKPFSI